MPLTAYPLTPPQETLPGCLLLIHTWRKTIRMTKYFDPALSREILETYQGYSLQVFPSGRIKLRFHRSHTDRAEYYAVKP